MFCKRVPRPAKERHTALWLLFIIVTIDILITLFISGARMKHRHLSGLAMYHSRYPLSSTILWIIVRLVRLANDAQNPFELVGPKRGCPVSRNAYAIFFWLISSLDESLMDTRFLQVSDRLELHYPLKFDPSPGPAKWSGWVLYHLVQMGSVRRAILLIHYKSPGFPGSAILHS